MDTYAIMDTHISYKCTNGIKRMQKLYTHIKLLQLSGKRGGPIGLNVPVGVSLEGCWVYSGSTLDLGKAVLSRLSVGKFGITTSVGKPGMTSEASVFNGHSGRLDDDMV